MKFEVPELPFDKDALAPTISKRTVDIHYEKHHKGYVKKLEKAIGDSALASKSLEEVILSAEDDVFNFAAQVWNHTFYWRSLAPGGSTPGAALADAIEESFGDLPALRSELAEAANGEFGSGWAWLVADATGKLAVRSSSDADNPLRSKQTPLLTIDVWEHAYYLDHQNERDAYVQGVVDELLNWEFATQNYEGRQR